MTTVQLSSDGVVDRGSTGRRCPPFAVPILGPEPSRRPRHRRDHDRHNHDSREGHRFATRPSDGTGALFRATARSRRQSRCIKPRATASSRPFTIQTPCRRPGGPDATPSVRYHAPQGRGTGPLPEPARDAHDPPTISTSVSWPTWRSGAAAWRCRCRAAPRTTAPQLAGGARHVDVADRGRGALARSHAARPPRPR